MIMTGYYLLHRTNISGMNTLFAQLWKEYALSDSRYLTSDVFTVCVETITVVST
jgi:cholestenol delta-isomerase